MAGIIPSSFPSGAFHMQALVTGSAGFLGFALAKKLSDDDGTHVFCVDNFCRGDKDGHYEALCSRNNVTHLTIDLSDPALLSELPSSIDVVFHLAALNGTQNFYDHPFAVMKHTALPTFNLVERYRAEGLKRFVFASSSEAYASTVNAGIAELPTSEDVLLSIDDIENPRWSYAAAKIFGEAAVINGCREKGISWSIIRYHNVFGPRMGDKHVIPDFLMRARRGEFALYGHDETRSFIYVDDAVRATIAVAASPACANEILNVGSSREISMRELAMKIMDFMELQGELKLFPSPKGSVKRRCPSVAKLVRLTGFQEDWSLEAGLQATAEAYLAR